MGTVKEPTQAGAALPRTPEQPQGRSDVAMTVVHTMRQLAVPGLPRNYELFYEAVTTGNRELAEALSALGSRPSQKALDGVASRFLKRGDDLVVDHAHDAIRAKLDEILTLLRKDRSSMETYGQILGETSSGLSSRQPLSREFLEKIVNVTAAATRSSIESRAQLASSIACKSGELQEVKSKLEEYKRLADTDALTQLANRRAFDRAISAVYDSNRNVAFSALILADVDRFKTINDRFGHPVGDRIIQIVASLIRSIAPDDAFVARTGGEEFAIILEGRGEDATGRVADSVRQAIMEAPFINVATATNYGPVTMSLGLCMATQAHGPDDLYAKADKALYASKAAGRNRVSRYSALSINDGNFTKNWQLYKSG